MSCFFIGLIAPNSSKYTDINVLVVWLQAEVAEVHTFLTQVEVQILV